MLSVNYIKEEQNYYEQKIKELIEKDEYNIRRNQRQQKEIDRLNNIIKELEKLIDSYELGKYDYEIPVAILKDKLRELKGENNDNN